jgi:hypothetical protein
MDDLSTVDTTPDAVPAETFVIAYRTPSYVVQYRRVNAAVFGPGSSAVLPFGTVGFDLPPGSVLVSDDNAISVSA